MRNQHSARATKDLPDELLRAIDAVIREVLKREPQSLPMRKRKRETGTLMPSEELSTCSSLKSCES